MTDIKLYFAPGACSLAPHILLHEADLAYTPIAFSAKEGLPASFTSINPKMRVPVLSLDGQLITENPAVMTAISQLKPELHFMGKTDLEKVRVYEWMNWLSGTMHGQGWGGIFRPHRFTDDQAAFDGVKNKGARTVKECFVEIESKLDESGHAVGGRFTAVDAYLYVFYRWAGQLEWDLQEELPRYTALVRRVVERKAVRKTLDREGLDAGVLKL